ncbi:hypothetical protein [Streptomyces sp. 4F14]
MQEQISEHGTALYAGKRNLAIATEHSKRTQDLEFHDFPPHAVGYAQGMK